jgi:hypothetical protein
MSGTMVEQAQEMQSGCTKKDYSDRYFFEVSQYSQSIQG